MSEDKEESERERDREGKKEKEREKEGSKRHRWEEFYRPKYLTGAIFTSYIRVKSKVEICRLKIKTEKDRENNECLAVVVTYRSIYYL